MNKRSDPNRSWTYFDSATTPAITPTREDPVGMSNLRDVPGPVNDVVDLDAYFEGRIISKCLLDQTGERAHSLVSVYYPPGTHLPRHVHNIDQVAFILEGEARQGNKVLPIGSGYFTPAGVAYELTAGPEGVRVLEFRFGSLGELTTTFVEDNPSRWRHQSVPGAN
jgi:hypothetical protein